MTITVVQCQPVFFQPVNEFPVGIGMSAILDDLYLNSAAIFPEGKSENGCGMAAGSGSEEIKNPITSGVFPSIMEPSFFVVILHKIFSLL